MSTRDRTFARVYVAGHAGMVGSAILRRMRTLGLPEPLTATRAELDLREQAAVRAFLEQTRPTAIIVAAAKVGGIEANRGGIVHTCTDGETHFAPLLPLVRAYITKRSCEDVFELGGILTDKVVALAAKEQGDEDRAGHENELEHPEAARQARAHAKRMRRAGQGRPVYQEAYA